MCHHASMFHFLSIGHMALTFQQRQHEPQRFFFLEFNHLLPFDSPHESVKCVWHVLYHWSRFEAALEGHQNKSLATTKSCASSIFHGSTNTDTLFNQISSCFSFRWRQFCFKRIGILFSYGGKYIIAPNVFRVCFTWLEIFLCFCRCFIIALRLDKVNELGYCNRIRCWRRFHDDVIKWKHVPRYWPFVRGIHRSPVNSTHNGQLSDVELWCFLWSSPE